MILMTMEQQYAGMSDRELLFIIMERQRNANERHDEVLTKIDALSKTVEELEKDYNQRSGIYKAVIFMSTILAAIATMLSIRNTFR